MQTIIIASTNPVKINAVRQGFVRMFRNEEWQTEGVSVASGVSNQPKGDAETLSGATTRAVNALQAMPHADYAVGIEGGVEDIPQGMACFAWTVVFGNRGTLGRAKTSLFFLPEKVAELVRTGKELGEADDIVFGRTNSKQANGAIGLLTNNVIDRTAYYEEAVILALIPFLQPEWYGAMQGTQGILQS